MTILYEDAWLIVCQKEAGILSAPKEGKRIEPDMLSLLADLFASRKEKTSPYLIHRLDRPTGGIMVFAKDQKTAALLSHAATTGNLQKEYLAVVEGIPHETQGTLCDLLFFDRAKDKTYVVKRPRHGVKEARLSFKTVATRATTTEKEPSLSLLQIHLETGRTHQIRAQWASRQLPLFGDVRYGAATRGPLGLFAAALSFPHPHTGEALCFSAQSPDILPFSLFSKITDCSKN